MRAGPPISDLVAGMNGALGIVAALLRRERTGQGDSVSVSLLGSMIGLLSFQASNYFADGRLPARTGNDHGIASPYGLFETADGQVAIAPSNDVVYHKLLDALELSELRADPRFATNADRMRNRGAITEAIQTRTREHTSAHWIERLNRFGVPCGQVLNLQEVFEDPQVQDQRMAIDVPHGDHGDVRMLGFPIKFAQAESRPVQAAPALGADTRDVLLRFGFAQEDIRGLQERGIV